MKWISLDAVKDTGKFLIEIMPIMFIPTAVGLVEAWSVLQPICVEVIITTLVTTVIVMGVTGRITQYFIRRGQKKEENEGRTHA